METEEQQDISKVPPQLQPHVFKKGQSGNPGGRPAGKSLKTYAREMIEAMTDEERQEFFNGMDKKVIWEMAEGKPDADMRATIDLTVDLTDEQLSRIIAKRASGTPPDSKEGGQ